MHISYNDITSIQNLCEAWSEFVRGKKHKKDVAEFSLNLSLNIYTLHMELKQKTYCHGGYHAFNIADPKPRNIHKATVRDRLLHHAIHRVLYPCFDTKFVHDSYSCRNSKGTHRAIKRFEYFARKVSHNYTKQSWILKCDISKIFANVDHAILLAILKKHIVDDDILLLLREVITSFGSGTKGKGLPLGNLTSQLLVNIYMNEFDQCAKHTLREKFYIRYADDFIFLSVDKSSLANFLPKVEAFLSQKLKLSLHPDKVHIKTIGSGVDFLGWVHFPTHRILRATTKRRMLERVAGLEKDHPTVQSYLGLLKHGDTHKLQEKLLSFLKS